MKALVITISDSCFTGRRQDVSGPAVVARLKQAGFSVNAPLVLPDEMDRIAQVLRQSTVNNRLIVTTGGTGIAARDVTPEATLSVCERVLDGFAERMRSEGLKNTPMASLSRAVSGTLGSTLIINLPGSPAGAIQSLESVLGLIPHALALLSGDTGHERGETR